MISTVHAPVAFSRPHTIIGTSVSVVALALLAGLHADQAVPWWQVLLVLIGGLATNIYIVGINQLADIEIDRINKPWLPLASGAMSVRRARLIVMGCVLAAVAIGAVTGPFALAAFLIGIVVGTAYSLPPLRLKRYAMWAALSIAGVRQTVVGFSTWMVPSR